MSQAIPQLNVSGSRLCTGNLTISEHVIASKTCSYMATGLLGGPSKPVGNALELTDAAASFLNEFLTQTTRATHASFLDSEIIFFMNMHWWKD